MNKLVRSESINIFILVSIDDNQTSFWGQIWFCLELNHFGLSVKRGQESNFFVTFWHNLWLKTFFKSERLQFSYLLREMASKKIFFSCLVLCKLFLNYIQGVYLFKSFQVGGDETRLGYLRYVQGNQPYVPARTMWRLGINTE